VLVLLLQITDLLVDRGNDVSAVEVTGLAIGDFLLEELLMFHQLDHHFPAVAKQFPAILQEFIPGDTHFLLVLIHHTTATAATSATTSVEIDFAIGKDFREVDSLRLQVAPQAMQGTQELPHRVNDLHLCGVT
jgi:hypothetical protein